MLTLRKNNQRGLSKTYWLDSRHTFSFGEYYDPQHMGFNHLRVINEDTVQPGNGFGKHPHQNMEIISYVVEGELKHEDSMGNGSIIKPGEIQKMSAGTGVEHSEFNPSDKNPLHFLQIWILPETRGLQPNYHQIKIKKETNKLILIGSNQEKPNTIRIYQNVDLYVAYLQPQQTVKHNFEINHEGWLQLIKGKITVNDNELSAGDGIAITEEKNITVHALTDCEFLLFDLG